MIILSFFEGIIAALGALALELSTMLIFNLPPAENALFTLFIFVAIEEILKYAVIYRHHLARINKKIILGALFTGLGFSLTELFLKQLDYQKESAFPVLGIIFIHILTTSLVGISCMRKYYANKLFVLLLIGVNILLHFGYNFCILYYF